MGLKLGDHRRGDNGQRRDDKTNRLPPRSLCIGLLSRRFRWPLVGAAEPEVMALMSLNAPTMIVAVYRIAKSRRA